jgi:hypothetical protein
MVSFTTAVSALALLASTSGVEGVRTSRQLSLEKIAGYEPLSSVTDHNAIDLDQEAMEQQLSLQNDDAFVQARKIYSEGAYSKSVAEVTLNAPLPMDVEKGTEIMGVGADGNQVAGKAYADNALGATSIIVQYQTSDSQKNYVACQVGASTTPNTEGCLVASGTLSIDGKTDVQYSYDPLVNNVAKRTIQGFSTEAQKKMAECENCPYAMYDKFYQYYGQYDYGNQIVEAAYEKKQTNFKNFNNDFGVYGHVGNEQIIKKATAYIVILMFAIRELEDALDDCQEACTIESCNDDPVHAWDVAAAFYVGSLELEDGSGSGKLTYALADKRCGNFATCGETMDQTSGTSKVNLEIIRNLSVGQGKLAKGECASARAEADEIQRLMLIPLIQGTLRYAWKTDNEAYSEKAEAEGVVFALSVVPAVAACDAEAANLISSSLQAGQAGTADFAAVKAAFEGTYECLGISGSEIGGLYDSATEAYFPGAEPSGFVEGSAAPKIGMAVTAGIAALASLSMFF